MGPLYEPLRFNLEEHLGPSHQFGIESISITIYLLIYKQPYYVDQARLECMMLLLLSARL